LAVRCEVLSVWTTWEVRSQPDRRAWATLVWWRAAWMPRLRYAAWCRSLRLGDAATNRRHAPTERLAVDVGR
jgi:hypothetical protein